MAFAAMACAKPNLPPYPGYLLPHFRPYTIYPGPYYIPAYKSTLSLAYGPSADRYTVIQSFLFCFVQIALLRTSSTKNPVSIYRVTIQLVANLLLTSEQKFGLGLARPEQARPKRNFCLEVNGRFATS